MKIPAHVVRPERYVLVTLPNGDERLEPLVEFGADGFTFLWRSRAVRLKIGLRLPRLRLFAEGAVSLDSPATVRELADQSTADGRGLVSRVGVVLEQPAEALVGGATDIYDDPALVMSVCRNLAEVGAAVSLSQEGRRADGRKSGRGEAPVPGRIVAWDESKGMSLRLDVPLPGSAHLASGPGSSKKRRSRVRVHAELFGSRVVLLAPRADWRDALCLVAPPTELHVFANRTQSRLRKLPVQVEVNFVAPAHDERRTVKAVDVSAHGVALAASDEDGLLVGMRLAEITIRLPTGSVSASAQVRNLRRLDNGELLVGLALTDLGDEAQRALSAFVVAHLHPRIRVATAEDSRALATLWEESAELPQGSQWLASKRLRAHTTRQTLLWRGGDLVLHLVGCEESDESVESESAGDVQGSAMLLRSYPGTLSLDHSVVRLASSLREEDLLVPLIQAALRRDDVSALHACLDAAGRNPLLRLRGASIDANDLHLRQWTVLRISELETIRRRPASTEVGAPSREDWEWVERRLADFFSPLERAVFALDRKDLDLEAIDSRYRAVGLLRRRHLRLATTLGGPLGLALSEESAAGLLPAFGNSTRLLVTSGEPRAQLQAAVALCLDAARDRALPPTVLAPPNLATTLASQGRAFEVVGTCVELTASRRGMGQVAGLLGALRAS